MKLNEFQKGEYEVLDLISSAWYGKQYYFLQDNGIVYSRKSGNYMTLDGAIEEFVEEMSDDGSI